MWIFLFLSEKKSFPPCYVNIYATQIICVHHIDTHGQESYSKAFFSDCNMFAINIHFSHSSKHTNMLKDRFSNI